MKIVLVLLNEGVARINKGWVSTFGKMAYAPTTLTQLAALVPTQLHAEIETIDEGVSFFHPDTTDANLVGLSVLTPNAPRAYQIAAQLKKRGITVILGGVHPTLLPEEAALHADAIVVGYAEKSWPRLLMDYASGNLQKKYTDDDTSIFTSSLPYPRYDLLKSGKYILPWTLETSRGCYNKCGFCVIAHSPCYNSFVHRNTDDVANHIRKTGAKRVTFLDSSPTENPEFVKELYQKLIPLKIKWSSSITLKTVDDNEWLQLAERSGCKGVLIGFESLNQASLSKGNKNFNQVKFFKEAVQKLHDHHISVLGCFVFGFDEDDKYIFQQTLDFVNDAKIDILNYTILTPYPNTPLYDQMHTEGRIVDSNWEHYNGMRVVYQPKSMSAEELQKGYEWASLKSYSLHSISKRLWPPRKAFGFNLVSNGFFSIYNHLRYK
jgi:radical SAM superfamily enzyme YgiQ (UPF0313 family)